MSEEKVYPYIGECVNGVVLFSSEGVGAALKKENAAWSCISKFEFTDGWVEGSFKNITREFLANTYGEVVSPEHAEFIIELAESDGCAGVEICKPRIANLKVFHDIYFNFYIDNGVLWFSFHVLAMASDRGEKQITIPLPPAKSTSASKVNRDIERAVKTKINDELSGGEVKKEKQLVDGNKYHREIIGLNGTKTTVDVYRVLDAFKTGCPATDHAIKKMLCAGLRGHKDKVTDYDNAIESLQAARLLLLQKGDES